jgi:hypothetical protein
LYAQMIEQSTICRKLHRDAALERRRIGVSFGESDSTTEVTEHTEKESNSTDSRAISPCPQCSPWLEMYFVVPNLCATKVLRRIAENLMNFELLYGQMDIERLGWDELGSA